MTTLYDYVEIVRITERTNSVSRCPTWIAVHDYAITGSGRISRRRPA